MIEKHYSYFLVLYNILSVYDIVQLANETTRRKSLIQSVKEQVSLSEKQKQENRELSQKLQGYRVSVKVTTTT